MAERPRRRPTKRRRRRGAGVSTRRRRRRFQRIDVDTAPKGPQLLILILGFIALAAITLNFFGPSLEEEEDLVTDFVPPRVEGPDFGSIDPSPFRSEITEFEEALFDTPGATDGRFEFAGQDIATAATPLLSRLRGLEAGRAEAAASDLDSLATDAGDDGFDLARLGDLRERWLQIRRSTFDSATWMKAASASEISGGEDRATHAVYQDIASDLLDLVESALSDAESLTEDEEYMDASEIADARLEWRDSVDSWRSDLRSLQEQMPARPSSGASPDLLSAIQRLESAMASTKGLFASSAAPKKPLNRRPYLRALESIERAREALDRI